MNKARFIFCIVLSIISFQSSLFSQEEKKKPRIAYKPVIEGEWWNITSQPDLGAYTNEKQQPVDFAVWQAEDGTWQLWSCIRGTNVGGKGRLFYRWQGKSLTDTAWQPMGIAMEADTTLAEQKGGLQAPFVFQEKGKYYMFYGDWNSICLAVSEDGKEFKRQVNRNNSAALFSGPLYNTRDPMVIKINGIYVCYYSAHNEKDDKSGKPQGAIYSRRSRDLKTWSEPVAVSRGGTPRNQTQWYAGDIECPFVVSVNDQFVLFRNQKYGTDYLNTQYSSEDPLNFGLDTDEFMTGQLRVAAPEIISYKGQYYIVSLKPGLNGMKMAKLKFVRQQTN